jgi:biopolymer transport protein ExbD
MNDSRKWPTNKGGNLNTFPDSLYSDLGKYILQNPTRNQRQMFFMPNITPLCGILIVLLSLFMIVSETYGGRGCDIDVYLKAKNFNYEDSGFSDFNKGVFLSIAINRSGKICLNSHEVENLEKLTDKIIDYCKDYGMQGEKTFIPKKIHFKAAAEIHFGTVVDVLKVFQKLGIQNVGFITEGYSQPLIEFFSDYPYHKIRSKRHQDSYSRIPLKY